MLSSYQTINKLDAEIDLALLAILEKLASGQDCKDLEDLSQIRRPPDISERPHNKIMK